MIFKARTGRTAKAVTTSAFLALWLVVALTWLFATPPFEAGDELWHYPMVRHLADGNPLPVQVFDPDEAGPWKQQASQPPLYYWLGAALTAWIDTSDWQEVRLLNPHVDNGIITPDGNTNLAVRHPDWNYRQGTLLAVYVTRLLSLACGLVTVWLTWKIGRLTHPHRPELALGAAALVGFLPMFLFVSTAVNNDNLVITLAAATLYTLIRPIAGHTIFSLREKLAVGALIGLAALTKISGVGLLPLAIGTLFIANWQQDRRAVTLHHLTRLIGRTTRDTLPVLLTAAAIAGWWYVRNIRLYGDWKGWNAFIAVLGQRNQPASLAQLWDERGGFLMSYWGLFGGVNLPMPGAVYTLLNGLLVVGLLGGVVYGIQQGIAFGRTPRSSAGNRFQRGLAWLFDAVAARFGLIVCLLWALAIVAGIIQWATVTWSSQGRLVFTALPAQMVLLITGLAGWLPPRLSRPFVALLAVGTFLLAATQPWLTLRPAWVAPLDQPLRGEALAGISADFAPSSHPATLRLAAASLVPDNQAPGGQIDLSLAWELRAPTPHTWSVFVHLVDPVLEAPVAQRDMYPGQGLIDTRVLEPGSRIVNRYVLALPDTLPAGDYLLQTGLYRHETGERMRLPDGSESVTLATIAVTGRAGELPNPLRVNFGHELQLRGYALETRRLTQGQTVDLTLWLEGMAALSADTSITAQIIADNWRDDWRDTTRHAAADLTLPTSQWQPGDRHAIPLTLTVRPDTPPGLYRLVIGLYRHSDGTFTNLPLVSADGRLTDDTLLTLTRVRIDP